MHFEWETVERRRRWSRVMAGPAQSDRHSDGRKFIFTLYFFLSHSRHTCILFVFPPLQDRITTTADPHSVDRNSSGSPQPSQPSPPSSGSQLTFSGHRRDSVRVIYECAARRSAVSNSASSTNGSDGNDDAAAAQPQSINNTSVAGRASTTTITNAKPALDGGNIRNTTTSTRPGSLPLPSRTPPRPQRQRPTIPSDIDEVIMQRKTAKQYIKVGQTTATPASRLPRMLPSSSSSRKRLSIVEEAHQRRKKNDDEDVDDDVATDDDDDDAGGTRKGARVLSERKPLLDRVRR